MGLDGKIDAAGCAACTRKSQLDFDFSMAFQPIIDSRARSIFAYEALVRGLDGESAAEVFRLVNNDNLYRFDQSCRVKAVKLAASLKAGAMLSINFMPNAVYKPELCIRTTLAAAEEFNFPPQQIIFEITEGEKVQDHAHLRDIIDHYKLCGFKTAIDDFGAGYSGLNLLAEIQTDLIKLDMALVRNIDQDKTRQAIVKGILVVTDALEITVIAEGVETYAEWQTLESLGIHLFQGFYFSRPAFEALPQINPQVYQQPASNQG